MWLSCDHLLSHCRCGHVGAALAAAATVSPAPIKRHRPGRRHGTCRTTAVSSTGRWFLSGAEPAQESNSLMQALLPRLRIVAIAGSLRAASYNRGLLRAAQDVAPRELTVTIRDLAPIPLYNAEVEAQRNPPPVAELKSAVQEADA